MTDVLMAGRVIQGVRGLLGNRPEWEERAACQEVDPDAFFPEPGQSARPALRICEKCPVKQECLTAALARREKHGVWGGLPNREFRKLVAELPKLPKLSKAKTRGRRRTRSRAA